MRRLPLIALLLPTVAIAQRAPLARTPAQPRCEAPHARTVADAKRPGIHKLDEMPPAKPIYTVVREIDGCPIPVSVKPR